MLKRISLLGLLALAPSVHAAPADDTHDEVRIPYNTGLHIDDDPATSSSLEPGVRVGPLGASKTNILLIIADDLGADKVTAYQSDVSGYAPAHIPQTTTIDGLASAGLRFTDAWANPVCSPTRAGLFTGRHAHQTGVSGAIPLAPDLSTSEVSLAEVLHGDTDGDGFRDTLFVNYAIGLFGKWHLGEPGSPVVDYDAAAATAACTTPSVEASTANPLLHGWDAFSGGLHGEVSDYWNWVKVSADSTGSTNVCMETTYATTDTVDEALNWINAQTGRWMATVSFNAPHTDDNGWSRDHADESCSTSVANGAAATSSTIAYQAMAECMDAKIQTLLDGIPDSELEDTLIVFIGDNGTDRAVMEDVFATATRGKGTVYESGVRVPFIVVHGQNWLEQRDGEPLSDTLVVSPGRNIGHLVHTTDLFATLADIAHSNGSAGTDSVSFADYLGDPAAASVRRTVYTETFSDKGAVTTGSAAIRNQFFKLVVRVERDSATSTCRKYELYRIRTDRLEATDLGGHSAYDSIKRRLISMLDAKGISWISSATDECA